MREKRDEGHRAALLSESENSESESEEALEAVSARDPLLLPAEEALTDESMRSARRRLRLDAAVDLATDATMRRPAAARSAASIVVVTDPRAAFDHCSNCSSLVPIVPTPTFEYSSP